MKRQLVIFGMGEAGRLARYYFEEDAKRDVAAFVVDDEFLKEDNAGGLPVVPFSQVTQKFPPSEYEMFVAVGWGRSNVVRQRKFDACRAAGYRLASYVSSRASVWPDLIHGENCLILEHSSIQPTARLGSDVMVGTGTRIGHGTVVGDHVSFASNVCVGGNSEIGARAFFSLGTIVRDHCKVGADVYVLLGASVTKNAALGSVILGPASSVADAESADFIRKHSFPD